VRATRVEDMIVFLGAHGVNGARLELDMVYCFDLIDCGLSLHSLLFKISIIVSSFFSSVSIEVKSYRTRIIFHYVDRIQFNHISI
jgi:hypothetical protein